MLRRLSTRVARVALATTATCALRSAAQKEVVVSELQQEVAKIVTTDKTFHPNLVEKSLDAFFNLGFSNSYTSSYTSDQVAHHFQGFISAQVAESEGRRFCYTHETPTYAFWMSRSDYESQLRTSKVVEDYIAVHHQYHNKDTHTHALSLRNYFSSKDNVILYCVEWQPFIRPRPQTEGMKDEEKKKLLEFTTLEDVTTKKFLDLRSDGAKKRYSAVLSKLHNAYTPVFTVTEIDGTLALTIGFRPERSFYLTALTALLHDIPGAGVTKRFVESFSNGMQVYTLFVTGVSSAQLTEKAMLIGQLPNTSDEITTLYNNKLISAEMVPFCRSLVMFAFYFSPPAKNDDYSGLATAVKECEASLRKLKSLRNTLLAEIMSETYITEVLSSHLDLVKELYAGFLKGHTAETIAAAKAKVEKLSDLTPMAKTILKTFVTFNEAIVKHNYVKVNKAAVAYRLDPKIFMGSLDFPLMPYGLFMFVGQQFRGFHVRFQDIARGGVRLIVSRNSSAYRTSKRTLFQENYNLAHAQLYKNKDIPESGSKGTILVTTRNAAEPKVLFTQYVDALLDVILPNQEGVVDKYGKEEIIFLGPDENTAGDFPSHAALHAKARGYNTWKAFTTGKDPDLGGIPHDVYGMTTESVRAHLVGVYKELGLKMENMTKFQTGGPDGDLGSNEILMGGEKHLGLTDANGVLFDPDGLNRDEIVRLAKARVTVDKFDRKKLGPRGFLVLTTDKNVKLPDGSVIEDGTAFRDSFFLSNYVKSDVFVPCGGRPDSVTIDNVHKLLINCPDVTGDMMLEGKVGNLVKKDQVRYKYIIEGANLFITQDARLALENVGVVLIKDSSANKGGVTSSSIEVFTALSLTDAEHAEHQCVKDGKFPKFYNTIVQQIVQRVRYNATREFDAIEREVGLGTLGGKRALISDALSKKIVRLRNTISKSDLYKDKMFVRYVMSRYVPPVLLEKVGIDNIFARVPEAYLQAIFAMWLASDFVYTAGVDADEFKFFQYMHDLYEKATKM